MTQNIIETVRQTIKEKDLIKKNGHVVVGLSGGPDSMCLFHALYTIREELSITISAVHLNHKFRPGAAEADQIYVENLCQKYGIYCYSKTVDVICLAKKRGETSEESGRNERYTAFDEEAIRVQGEGICAKDISIAVAQNRNDQVETLLMRILRGTGTDGLAGIPYQRRSHGGFRIIRPLLNVDRADIERYCSVNALEPRIDHTNQETDYRRNKIRLDLIPRLMEDYNDRVEDAIIRLSCSAASDKAYFEEIVNDFLSSKCRFDIDKNNKTISASVNIKLINKVHNAVKVRILTGILKKLGLEQGIRASHIDSAIKAVENGQTGKVIEFPEGYRMKITYRDADFYNAIYEQKRMGQFIFPKPTAKSIKLDDIAQVNEVSIPQGVLHIGIRNWPIDTKLDKNTVVFDFDALLDNTNTLKIRYRQAGDKMFVKGMKGTKKLQDLLVDEKVPKEKRDRIPILVSETDILWVMGIRYSSLFSCSGLTKRCLLLEWKPNN